MVPEEQRPTGDVQFVVVTVAVYVPLTVLQVVAACTVRGAPRATTAAAAERSETIETTFELIFVMGNPPPCGL
jgi:hypothetical protein